MTPFNLSLSSILDSKALHFEDKHPLWHPSDSTSSNAATIFKNSQANLHEIDFFHQNDSALPELDAAHCSRYSPSPSASLSQSSTTEQAQSEHSVITGDYSTSNSKLSLQDNSLKRKSRPSNFNRPNMGQKVLPDPNSNVCKFCGSSFLSALELECHLSYHLKELRKKFPEEYEQLVKRKKSQESFLSRTKRPRFSLGYDTQTSPSRRLSSESTVEILNRLIPLAEAKEPNVRTKHVEQDSEAADLRQPVTHPPKPSNGRILPLASDLSSLRPFGASSSDNNLKMYAQVGASNPNFGCNNSNLPKSVNLEGSDLPEPCCEWFCSYFSLPCRQTNLPSWCKPQYQIPGPHREEISTFMKSNEFAIVPSSSPLLPLPPTLHNPSSVSPNSNGERCAVRGDDQNLLLSSSLSMNENLATSNDATLAAQTWFDEKTESSSGGDSNASNKLDVCKPDSLVDLNLRL